LKLDGWRAMAGVVDGSVQVRTRRGKDVTPAVPELSRLHLPDAVLDGELVIGAGRLSDFYGLAGRLAGKPRNGSAVPVTFAAFDVLWLDGELRVDEPDETRRRTRGARARRRLRGRTAFRRERARRSAQRMRAAGPRRRRAKAAGSKYRPDRPQWRARMGTAGATHWPLPWRCQGAGWKKSS
jgi:ATP-dependent DNA ligase